MQKLSTPFLTYLKLFTKVKGNILRSHLLKSKDSYLISLDASYPIKKELPIDIYKEHMKIYFTYFNLLESRKNYENME